MAKDTPSSGFSIVEALLILVAVGILGFTGWYVYHAQQASDKDYSTAASSTVPAYKKKTAPKTTSTTSQYAGWSTYCSTTGEMCFKYPSGWQEADNTQANDITVTSPSKAVQVVYNPSIDGVGGACPSGCLFNEESVTPLSSSNKLGLEVIKGVFTNQEDSSNVFYMPYYYLTTTDKMADYHLQLNQTVNVGFFGMFFTSPADSSGIESLAVQSNPLPESGYPSVSAANAWLGQSEVKTAGQILGSAYVKD